MRLLIFFFNFIWLTIPNNLAASVDYKEQCECSRESETGDIWTCFRSGQALPSLPILCGSDSSNIPIPWENMKDSCEWNEITYHFDYERTVYKNRKTYSRKLNAPFSTNTLMAWAIAETVRENAAKAGIQEIQFQEICNNFKKLFLRSKICGYLDAYHLDRSSLSCRLTDFSDTSLDITFFLEESYSGKGFKPILSAIYYGSFRGKITCRLFCEKNCHWSCALSHINSFSGTTTVRKEDSHYPNGYHDHKLTCEPLSPEEQISLLNDLSNSVNSLLGTM